MIRRARLFDVSAIVLCVSKFYPNTSYSRKIPLDHETVFELTTKLIQHGIVFVAEVDKKIVGVIGLSVHPFLFNKNHMVSGEVVWWIEPQAQKQGWGRKLLETADQECKNWGLISGQLFLMEDSPPIARTLYESLGYNLTELSFTKEF